MDWKSAKILLASTATAVVASQVAKKLYKYFFKSKQKCSHTEIPTDDTCNEVLTIKNREINDVILFSDDVVRHTIKVPPNKDVTICESRELNCFKLIKYIKSARETLDVCMYLITSSEIAEHIIRLGQKHVLVRIVVDSDMAFTPQSQINKLKEYSKYNLSHYQLFPAAAPTCNSVFQRDSYPVKFIPIDLLLSCICASKSISCPFSEIHLYPRQNSSKSSVWFRRENVIDRRSYFLIYNITRDTH